MEATEDLLVEEIIKNMGKLRKIGRKIKKGVKKLFSSKIGRIVGMVGLYFAMGAVAKGLSNWFGSTFGKASTAAAETTVAAESAVGAGGGFGVQSGTLVTGGGGGGTIGTEAALSSAEISEVAKGTDALSKKVSTLIETSPTNVDAANNAYAALDSSAIIGNTTPSSTITDALVETTESNILDQTVPEVTENLNLLEKNKGFAEGSGPKVDFPKVETDGFGEGATGGLGTQSNIFPTQGVEATVPAEKSIATNIKDYFVGPDSTVVPDTIAGVGTGMIMSQFQDEPEGGTRMGIVPAPPLVQAQGAYLQEVGPMMANVTGVPNFNNITQMANQSVYGVGTPNHLAGLYG